MYIGIDIGGTKCAVILADSRGNKLRKIKFATTDKDDTLSHIISAARELSEGHTILGAGISCGGPLDEEKGLILSPPNLPGWDAVPIVELITDALGIPTRLCNDANACALAEWKFGAGRGTKNMVFFTFGTGLGAGLILDGRLYAGTNGNAGEAGHIRLDEQGPVGYGKVGSFEGFCSGGGIRQLGQALARDAIGRGESPSFCPTLADLDSIDARLLAQAADAGDPIARQVFDVSAARLGQGLSIIIDLLNPEVIVLGSIYARATHLFYDGMMKVIGKEALAPAASCCKILPAALGDEIGDFAAIAVAMG